MTSGLSAGFFTKGSCEQSRFSKRTLFPDLPALQGSSELMTRVAYPLTSERRSPNVRKSRKREPPFFSVLILHHSLMRMPHESRGYA